MGTTTFLDDDDDDDDGKIPTSAAPNPGPNRAAHDAAALILCFCRI